ncbi:conserved hypothetical protein [Leishmania major strain Friedlin]|uniref:SAC3/GANP/THP3 conserved domain-containing protein n=1 Tax=Leishmania major TaxID=5664 RepID=Q4QGR3_LEIMA|nr:conserved hypothetical protein [Leishmania major strain Friedlin]CAG9570436.1 hypothetical_protein_-_conserved [Leishmania major strain Friedlin]CAJ02517.1 conserved hypothetical protein [Leishmania major strain Friedlin]|eukprot:XP_001681635.1 conserved hypothetical protein [Leishmania major strain Friedlin]
MQGSPYSHQSTTAEAVDAPYSDAHIATVLSLSPFSDFCKLRDKWAAKPLIRGCYVGMCGGDPAQRERREDFELITLNTSPSASSHAFGGGARLSAVWGQVEAYSRSAAGKTIDPAQQRTPLALEKSMHFLVEHYLRVPHTPLVYAEPFRVWGYLWDRFRGIRTTWGPQLPPSNVSLQGYVDSETGRTLSVEELHRESYRRVRWLEFTVAALAVGGAYLCCSPEGCQRFMQDKKQFLESMSQCFTDLTVFYRAEQRHRNAEFFSVLLLLYGLQQEMKVEDRSSFCRFHTVIVNGEPRLCPENASESVNLAQVYRELEKQPHMLETQPVRVALELIHFWAARQWFQFFEFCKSAPMTLLQRAVVFQSFTYGRYRAVLDLVLPNYYVYPKLRVRHAILVAELADQLMMNHDHCLEFLKRMGLDAQLECKTPHQLRQQAASSFYPIASPPSGPTAATVAEASASGGKAGWYLNLCHPNSDPLITADELEKRCVNKRALFFPTHPTFFGFRVSHVAYERFPDAKGFPTAGTEDVCDALAVAGSSSPVGRGAVRSPSGLQGRVAPRSKPGTLPRRRSGLAGRGDSGDGGDEDYYFDEYCHDGGNDEECERDDGSGSDDGGAYRNTGDGCDSPPQRQSTVSPPSAVSPSLDKEAALLGQPGCPVNLMEVLEVYCPPYNSEVAALRLSDASEELFASLPAHRAEMLLRCRDAHRRARHWQRASARDADTAAAVPEEEALYWAEKMEMESVSTASSLFDGSDDDDVDDDEGEGHDVDAPLPHRTAVADVSLSSRADAVPPAVIEARQLLTAIRDNPLYAAAAADHAEAEEKARRAKQAKADARRGTTAAEAARSDQPQQAPTLSETGSCIVAPLPDDDNNDADQRCKSQNPRVAVELPATLPTRRLVDIIGNDAGAQAVTEGSARGPRDVSATHQERQQSVDREDSATTVEPHRHLQPQKPASPSPPLSMPTLQPLVPTAANVFTPGKREPTVVAGTDNTTPIPTAGQREGSSSGSSSGSGAPMLGYSHLKPLKQTLSGDGEDDEKSAGADTEPGLLSGSDEPTSASAVDGSEATLDSSSAEGDTSAPPCPPLWGGQRALPVPPSTVTSDSFTPRFPPETRPEYSAAGAVSHRTGGEAARGAASENESGEDAVAEVRARVSDEGVWKHHRAETAWQRGVRVQRPSPVPIPAASVDVFARACVPLIEEYLHLWVRLTHEDDTTLRTAAQYVLDIREAQAEAPATQGANGGPEGGDEARCAVHTRRGRLAQRRCNSALRGGRGATVAASTWWRQRRLRSTARAMALVARQLLTTAVLRGSMSEYGQLMRDLSLSGWAPSKAADHDSAFGGGLHATDPSRRGVAMARATQRHCATYDDSDDARAARLSRGCSVAMLSASNVDAILAAAQTQSNRTLASTADGAVTAWPLATSAASTRSAVPFTFTQETAGLGYAKDTCEAALGEAMNTVFSCAVGAVTLPARDSLAALLSSAVDVSLDSADACSHSRRTCTAAALQLTSIYIWVSAESYCDCECPATPVAVADTGAADAALFARLFQSERERWLVSVMLPATACTAFEVFGDVDNRSDDDDDDDDDDDERPSRGQSNARRRGRKRCRSSAQHSHVGDNTRSVRWLSEVDTDPHSVTCTPSPAPLVARLFQRDHVAEVRMVRSAVLSPGHSVGASAHGSSTLPLVTRIALYGCDTHTLPRLRVRRDGGVRLAQQHSGFSADDGHAKAEQVQASPDSTRALAMSHAHYTAFLTVDIAEPGYMVKARRALAAVVASHVGYTTTVTARGAATAMEWNGHWEGVPEQNCVEGIVLCLLSSPAQLTDTASIVAELEGMFSGLWHHRHGAGERHKTNTVAAASAPAVVGVEIVYGDAEGARAAMKKGMRTLLSTYAQQAMTALDNDS